MAKRANASAARSARRPVRHGRPSPAEPAVRAGHRLGSDVALTHGPRPVFPPPVPPAAEAVGLFQTGMAALQRHQYPVAAEDFRALLDRFPTERALLDRARLYLDLCEREIRRHPTELHTAEERLTAATAALNDGDEARAESLVGALLADTPDHEHGLYLAAAIHARRGHRDAALDELRRAIEVNPDVAAQASLDSDFDGLRDSAVFQSMTDALSAPRPRRH